MKKNRTSKSTSSTYTNRTMIIFFLSVFLATVLIVASSFVWRWMSEPTSFPITQLRVEGKLVHETPVTILHIMQKNLTGGFFSLNVVHAERAILALPWIVNVSFRRVWPHTLVVQLTEQQAVARFGKTGVLNAEGNIFYPPVQTVPQNLPSLKGPIDQSKALFSFYHTVNTLTQLLGLTVIALRVNAEQSWDLEMSNHIRVALGYEQALARFKRFIAIYPQIKAASNRTIRSVDLRYPDGVAVRYAGASNMPTK